MPITIKDIAKIANVSHTTVSRALRGHPAISAETIARVQEVAHELGYIPSAAARSLKTNRSHVLGVIVQRIADPFFGEVLDGIQDVLQQASYSLFISSPGDVPEYEEAAIQAMIEQRIDGLLVCSAFLNQESYQKLESADVPLVIVHNYAPEDFKYSIYHDDFQGGKIMTTHLIQLGHTRIGYVANSQTGRISRQRLAGYRAALEEAKLPFEAAYVVDAKMNTLKGGVEAAQELMNLIDMPSAIFCYNDFIAIGVIQALQQAGIQVPDQCSVAGFDNISLTQYVQPSLTTFDQPKYYLGTVAANMMLKLLSNDLQGLPTEMIVLRGKLIVRHSTAVYREM